MGNRGAWARGSRWKELGHRSHQPWMMIWGRKPTEAHRKACCCPENQRTIFGMVLFRVPVRQSNDHDKGKEVAKELHGTSIEHDVMWALQQPQKSIWPDSCTMEICQTQTANKESRNACGLSFLRDSPAACQAAKIQLREAQFGSLSQPSMGKETSSTEMACTTDAICKSNDSITRMI